MNHIARGSRRLARAAVLGASAALFVPGSAYAGGSCVVPARIPTQVVASCTVTDNLHRLQVNVVASWVPVSNGAIVQFECTADSDPDATQTSITACDIGYQPSNTSPAKALLVPFSMPGPAVAVQGQGAFNNQNLMVCFEANSTYFEGTPLGTGSNSLDTGYQCDNFTATPPV